MTPTILLIEDERATAWALAQGLTDEGWVVTTVGRAEDALTCLERSAYDVVISDVRLPGMDGIELARRLARTAPDVPAILVTAHGTHDVRDEAMRAGACVVFEKPFGLNDIKAAVRRALDDASDRRARAA